MQKEKETPSVQKQSNNPFVNEQSPQDVKCPCTNYVNIYSPQTSYKICIICGLVTNLETYLQAGIIEFATSTGRRSIRESDIGQILEFSREINTQHTSRPNLVKSAKLNIPSAQSMPDIPDVPLEIQEKVKFSRVLPKCHTLTSVQTNNTKAKVTVALVLLLVLTLLAVILFILFNN